MKKCVIWTVGALCALSTACAQGVPLVVDGQEQVVAFEKLDASIDVHEYEGESPGSLGPISQRSIYVRLRPREQKEEIADFIEPYAPIIEEVLGVWVARTSAEAGGGIALGDQVEITANTPNSSVPLQLVENDSGFRYTATTDDLALPLTISIVDHAGGAPFPLWEASLESVPTVEMTAPASGTSFPHYADMMLAWDEPGAAYLQIGSTGGCLETVREQGFDGEAEVGPLVPGTGWLEGGYLESSSSCSFPIYVSRTQQERVGGVGFGEIFVMRSAVGQASLEATDDPAE